MILKKSKKLTAILLAFILVIMPISVVMPQKVEAAAIGNVSVTSQNLTYGGSPYVPNAWGISDSPYTLVENAYMVDPDSRAVSLTWVAPANGIVNLYNNQSYAQLSNATGNGVRLRVIRGNQVIFPTNGSWQDISTTALVLITAPSFSVSTGDKVYFIVDNKGDSSYDATALVAKVNFTPSGGSETLYDSTTSYSTTTQGTNGFYYQTAVVQESFNLYSVNGMWSWYGEGSILDQFKNYCNVVKKKGFNAVTFDISMDRVEATQNVYDFSYYDPFFDYAVTIGLKMYMRVSCRILPTWIPTTWYMRDQNGNLLNIQDNTGGSRILNYLSYANSDARNAVTAYYSAVVSHYQSRYSAYANSPIIEYMTMFTQTAEYEYNMSVQTDYSDAAKTAFRTWLTNKYGSIAVLNNMWGTSNASFAVINPPLLTNQSKMARYSDFLKFRRDMQITFTQQLQTAVHNASSTAKFGVVFGSIYDNMGIYRGTLFADYLIPYCDAIHVADAPNYYFAYSMDLLRGISMGKPFGNEIDGPSLSGASNTVYQNQWSTTLSRGGTSAFVANWYSSEFTNSVTFPFIDNLATYVKNNGPTTVAPTVAMYTSTATLEKTASFVTASQTRYNSVTNNGATAIDIIRDASFVNNPSYLNKYSTIYFDANTALSDEARVALLAYVAQGGQILYNGTNYGTLDEYNNARDPLNNISDTTKPTLLLDTTKNGQSVQGSSYILHGISKDTGGAGVKTVTYSINGGAYVNATGLTQFSITISGAPATYTVNVKTTDNKNNVSTTATFTVTLTA